ncbi:c-type cytochrome [Bradyrhizobium sp.]|uniref:c-type cytochrome n=1 Tax=Bradyrhizobium sp. TaxID=376 RepID=UPI002D05A6FE|nr:cytochrome c [Bradyrhizobium sp.]HMM92164.1 cytochrome c [Bradyrhizobium sp.]
MTFAYPRAAVLAVCSLVPAFVLVAACGAACAGDVNAGRAKAMMCQACHGMDGLSLVPDAPNLAAQTEPYLVTQLRAYKSGIRKNDAMTVVSSSLSDKDVEDLAAYYSTIEIKIVKVPGE